MSTSLERRVARVVAAIEAIPAAAPPERLSRFAWILRLADDRVNGPVTAELEDDWLVLRTRAACAYGSSWRLVEACSGIAGPTKVVAHRPDPWVSLAADIPMDDEVNVPARVQEAIAGIAMLAERLGNGAASEFDDRDAGDPLLARTWQEALLEEIRWPYSERAAAGVCVELEATEGLFVAALEHRANGSLVASLELARAEAVPEASREAIATLLSTAAAELRLVRPTAAQIGDVWVAGMEVVFATKPCAQELAHALSTLSVAARQAGREAQVLMSTDLARRYLAALGCLEPSQKRQEGDEAHG
jgi:hypothetical protein